MYEKIRKHYDTRYSIFSSSAIGLIISVILTFFNQDLGSSIGASIIICFLGYLLILTVTFPLRIKGEWEEYKVQIKQELKEEYKEISQKMKNNKSVPNKPLLKGLIIYLVCVFIVFIIPKGDSTISTPTVDSSKNANETIKKDISTKIIAKELQKALNSSTWNDIQLKPVPAMPENYSASSYKSTIEKHMMISDFGTYISVEFSVYGSSDDAIAVFQNFGEGLGMFALYRPEKKTVLSKLAKEGIPVYVDEFISKLRVSSSEPSLEYKIDNDLTYAVGGQVMGDNTVNFHSKIFYKIRR